MVGSVKSRRWRDPRTRRSWQITASPVRRPGEGADGRAEAHVCFDSLATPRQGHSGRCCERVEDRLAEMDDQGIALCLDGIRREGFLWIDPRDSELWSIQPISGGPGLRFVGTRGDRRAEPAREVDPRELSDDALMRLLDGATPDPAE